MRVLTKPILDGPSDSVDQILAAKQRDAGADTTALEQDHRKRHGTGIDRLVDALYGLTPAEIKLVEESAQRC